MKKGFTTGSCAAAASKAAAMLLLGGSCMEHISIQTPAGEEYCPKVLEKNRGGDFASCAIRKESGDDPDITNHTLIFAKVSFGKQNEGRSVVIDGGEGIGRVTRPGLDQPVGNAAINSVPRQMIEKEVTEVMELFDYNGSLQVEIYAPEGKSLGEKTFNPRLGIEGGISIIGTTGIVEPMSTKALLDTIKTELCQKKAMGTEVAVISPGNYGLDFMKNHYGYDLDQAVKCANYIGDTIDMAIEAGFQKILLCGHIGKLIKVSGGIMNTHSKEADCRMELMMTAALQSGADTKSMQRILSCVSTEEAIGVMEEEEIKEKSFAYIMDRIGFYLKKRGGENADVRCIVYSNQYGLLGETKDAHLFLNEQKG
ncbi:MAG: cobalt-precorrin-5B (C(1))-methyltransferase CbiD [Lachnospiraceae bacterium]|nr:cobalt-precorrin-5B (C(1))-methyltransferase CbiD [Lachnospiraceae bacterium]